MVTGRKNMIIKTAQYWQKQKKREIHNQWNRIGTPEKNPDING